MTLIIGMKEYLEPFYKNKIKKTKLFRNVQIPIPTELFVVNIFTVFFFDFIISDPFSLDHFGNINFILFSTKSTT